MRIAVTDWNDKISPVFDESNKVLICDTNGSVSTTISLEGLTVSAKAKVLNSSGVNVLICGAISDFARQVLTMKGIEVHAWLHGSVQEALKGYCEGKIDDEHFTMPGCTCLRLFKKQK